ncbi:hypothetical protein N8Z24_00230 [bacterium]|nr:hypothetical protein [bacterium]
MKRVYICHPYRSDPEGNLKAVEKIVTEIGLETLKKMRDLESRNFVNSPHAMGSIITVLEGEELYEAYSDELICPVSAMQAFPAGMNSPAIKFDHEVQELAFCLSLLKACEEIWVYSRDLSEGMVYEVEKASEFGIKVVWKV